MLSINTIPAHVIQDLKERGHSEEQIKAMSAKEAFNEYLAWNGILGWGSTLWHVVERLKEAEKVGSN